MYALLPAAVYVVACEILTGLSQAPELASLSSQSLYSVKWSAPHKGLWAGNHVSSPTTLLGYERERERETVHDSVMPARISYMCALTCTTQMPTLSPLPFLSVLFSLTLRLTHPVCTLSHTLFPRSPCTVLQAQLPKATGDRQCFPLLKSLIESPVALTQHLPCFCVC